VDRLIYASDTDFDPNDARLLLVALPRRTGPRIEIGIAGKFSGRSTRGYAAGVGDTRIEGKDRTLDVGTGRYRYSRAGQWKLIWQPLWRGRHSVEIEQVMADPTDEGRGARIHYEPDGTPTTMDIRVPFMFRLFWLDAVRIVVPGWKPWKVAAAQPSTSSTMPS